MPTGIQKRDRGFENLSLATRWVAAGALGLAGLLTAAAAHALPGHGRPAVAPSGATGAGAQGRDQGSGSTGLQPPSQAPTISTAPPQVVSGGS